jgi:hypothetical protein
MSSDNSSHEDPLRKKNNDVLRGCEEGNLQCQENVMSLLCSELLAVLPGQPVSYSSLHYSESATRCDCSVLWYSCPVLNLHHQVSKLLMAALAQ